ncbi:MAG TPA: hypothetical protein VIM10_07645 [Actinopolymorphaceae bacterium]
MADSASAFQGNPIDLLVAGVDSYADCLRADGELLDPVMGVATQYGTAYHAYANAVIAEFGPADVRDEHLDRALRGVEAALRHTSRPELAPTASGFVRETASVRSAGNHRDFTWPPILKTVLILERLGADAGRVRSLKAAVAGVDVHASFRSRPPSNWCAVWMSGEWIRMREGLSPTRVEEFDGWLDVFFDEVLDSDLGLFLERGYPNAYDLFTKAHLADLLVEGYDGRNRQRLLDFLTAGVKRSLAMQLSDGSVASGYRSAGQTWTLGAQVAFFTSALRLELPGNRDDVVAAAWRAFSSMPAWQRPGGYYSPVLNLQPPERRVGYEGYTADGHYANLALAFLATGLRNELTALPRPGIDELDRRPAVGLGVEPITHRGVLHEGRVSLAVQAQADGVYDGTGLVDVTFGVGRMLQFVSSARHRSGGPWINLGLGLRSEPARTPTVVVSGRRHRFVDAGLAGGQLTVDTVIEPLAEGDDPVAGWAFRGQWRPTPDGIEVVEGTPGHTSYPTLFVPYPSDLGGGLHTAVSWIKGGARFGLGEEWVEVTVDASLEGRLDLPDDYENRRGLCGLVRLDLAEPAEFVSWRIRSSA